MSSAGRNWGTRLPPDVEKIEPGQISLEDEHFYQGRDPEKVDAQHKFFTKMFPWFVGAGASGLIAAFAYVFR